MPRRWCCRVGSSRTIFLRLSLIGILGLCVLAIHQQTGWADDDGTPPVTVQGTWTGTFHSSVDPSLSGPVSLVISDQDGHRFTATITEGPPEFPHNPGKGIATPSGEVSVVFKGLGKKGMVHGTVTGKVMTLDYLIHSGGPASDRGAMTIANSPTT